METQLWHLVKGGITLAIYIAIGMVVVGPAGGQPKEPPTYYPIPPGMQRAFATSDPLLDQLSRQSAAKTAEIAKQVVTVAPPGPIIAPPSNAMLQVPIVISFGRGGKVDEHRQQFAIYQSRKAKVEVRGPCYSACTLLLAYVEPDNLCIAPNAFMAFHAIRSAEHGEIMVGATQKYYADMPTPIRRWIDHNGGWHNLPLNGYWTMYDHSLWALGYPKCN